MWPFRRARGSSRLGRRGEALARRHLKRRGLKILAENYRCPAGEADLIALDRPRGGPETVAFVEVKTRRSDRYTDPQFAVDAAKQRRLRRIADYYLHQRDAEGLTVRFDIVSVVMPEGEKPRVKHIADAF